MFGLLLKHLKQALNTLWNEEMTKIKVIDLDELYNFGIHHFLAEIIWGFKILLELVIFLNLKIWIVQTLPNEKNDQINTIIW